MIFLQEKMKCFYSILTNSSVLYQNQSHQCRRPPPSPRRNTERIPSVLGTHTRKSRRPVFIPSNITTLIAMNTPNYMLRMSWFSATTSPKSPDGIGLRVVPPHNCADTDGYVDVRTGKKYALHGDDSFFKDIK